MTRGGATSLTSVARRKVTPCARSSQPASFGERVPALDAALVRAPERPLDRALAEHGIAGTGLAAVEQLARRAHLRRRERLEHRHRLRPLGDHDEALLLDGDARPAAATSSQTSRERRARRQHSPRCWPVTVMKPKLRTDAPIASRSRSITTTRSPRRAAASACASPTMPAPTTARSKLSAQRVRQAWLRPIARVSPAWTRRAAMFV